MIHGRRRAASLRGARADAHAGGKRGGRLVATARRSWSTAWSTTPGARGVRGGQSVQAGHAPVPPIRAVTISRRHVFREVTVRRLYRGLHRIEVQVNGRVLGGVDVELTAPDTAPA
jgi:hypothetical protein